MCSMGRLVYALALLLSTARQVSAKLPVLRGAETVYQECIDDLYVADGNGDLALRQDEYLNFISIRSNGKLVYDEYGDMPLSLITYFNFAACFCTMISSDDMCCTGDRAHVNLDTNEDEVVIQNLITLCMETDEAIAEELPPTRSPTTPPTEYPTQAPTPPTSAPTGTTLRPTPIPPTSAPTGTLRPTPLPPTSAPTGKTLHPTLAPSYSPTLEPTSMPTLSNMFCFNFQYGIVNDAGYDADDLFSMVDNTFKTGLIIATRNVTIEVLNATYPRDGRLLQRGSFDQDSSESPADVIKPSKSSGRIVPLSYFKSAVTSELIDSESRDNLLKQTMHQTTKKAKAKLGPSSRRRLVYYTDALEPEVLTIFEALLCPNGDPLIECSIVYSTVCVLLEPGDVESEVRTNLVDGIQESISNGQFEAAIPPEHQLPEPK